MLDKNLRTQVYNLGMDDLRALNGLVVEQIRSLNRQASYDFKVGDTVRFKGKWGETVTGRITRRVRGRNGRVDVVTLDGFTRWRVSASCLELVPQKPTSKVA